MVRIKHRYLLLNFLYPEKEQTSRTKSDESVPWTVQFRRPSSDRLDARLLTRMIRDGVAELFGDYGSGMVAGSLQVKYVSPATSTAIVRVGRAHYRMVWAALTFATKIPKPVDKACVIQVVRVSGTIKKAEEEAVRRARAVIARAQRARDVQAGKITPAEDATSLDDWNMTSGIEDADEPANAEGDEDD